jgi:hypothetical protein
MIDKRGLKVLFCMQIIETLITEKQMEEAENPRKMKQILPCPTLFTYGFTFIAPGLPNQLPNQIVTLWKKNYKCAKPCGLLVLVFIGAPDVSLPFVRIWPITVTVQCSPLQEPDEE